MRQRTSYNDMFAELQRQQKAHARAIRKLQNTPRMSMPWRLVSSTFPPVDPLPNEKIVYQADATKGINWEFVYNGTSANANKWEYVGGPPLYSFVSTAESSSSGTYANLSTVGPTVTIPRTGEYKYELFVHVAQASAAQVTYAAVKLGSAATSDLDAAIAMSVDTTGFYRSASWSMVRSATAGDVWQVQYKINAGSSTLWRERHLFVTPVRVQ